MAYPQPPRIKWDKPGLFQGVTIQRLLEDGNWYAWRVPYNGVVTQAVAAEILEVSVMTVNNWVNAGVLPAIKYKGTPSLITLWEIKRIRKKLRQQRRLPWKANNQ